MKIAFLFPALLCLTSSLCAQAPQSGVPVHGTLKPEQPSGPLLRPAADFSQWEISFTYLDDKQNKDKGSSLKASNAGEDMRPRKIVTTKTGRIVHEEQTDGGNRVTSIWFEGATQYFRSGNSPIWLHLDPDMVLHTATAASYEPLPPSGFRGLDFVQANNYAGTVSYGKGNCLIFTPGGYQKLDLSDPGTQQKHMESIDIIAYIDDETRLPIAVRTHGETRTFHFDPPPTEMQTFPVDLADQIKKAQEARARLEMPAPRPY